MIASHVLAERVLPHVQMVLDDVDACWPWTKGVFGGGYGMLRADGQTFYAHRVMWELTWGRPVPHGKCVCHTCDNRICCRPSHFFLGTRADNNLDCNEKGRRNQVRGEQNPKAKLTEAQVCEIRDAPTQGIYALAKRLGVTYRTVYLIRTRGTWKHIQ